MKDLFDTLLEAFPVLKNHPVAMARILVVLLVLIGFYSAKSLRKRVCQSLLAKLSTNSSLRGRLLYVYQDCQTVKDWKYYTAHATGSGSTGDDIVWTLVNWPSLRRKDSLTLFGVVGMVDAVYESRAKLLGRWDIVHDPDRQPIGVVPARGLKSKIYRAFGRVLMFVNSL